MCYLCGVWVAASVSLGQAPEPSTVHSLEALVGEWVALRDALAKESSEWAAERQALEAETELLQAEKVRLQDRIQEQAAEKAESQKDRQTLSARRVQLKEQLAELSGLTSTLEATLRAHVARVPVPLRKGIEDGLRSLPATDVEAARRTLSSRMQTVMALCVHLEELNRDVHVVQELIPQADGRKLLMDVVYLGLARGFAVSGDDRVAMTGHSDATGWRWDPDPGLAAEIRAAHSVASRKDVARLLSLPLLRKGETP